MQTKIITKGPQREHGVNYIFKLDFKSNQFNDTVEGLTINVEEKDDIAEAKIMISHPQFNGLQANPVTTEMIEAYFIYNVEVTYNDKIVMSLESDISISQDPTFRFNFLVGDGGDLKITAKDIDGNVYSYSEKFAMEDNQLKIASQ